MTTHTHLRIAIIGAALFHLQLGTSAADHPAPLPIPDSDATTEAAMKPYTELVEHTDAKIEMVPIKGGKFLMGSPETEKGRYADEGPQHEVEISPFWMAKCEITWDAYDVWTSDLDILRRQVLERCRNAARQARRSLQPHAAHQALHRHDLRHGQAGLSRPSA